jgi:hypothetical protein
MEKIPKLNYEEKKQFFSDVFSLGSFSETDNVNDLLILISLISLSYLKLKETNPNITVLSILIKISGKIDKESSYYNMLENLSIIVEEFCYNKKNADSCGLKDSKEIINKIKSILNTWIPF